MQQREYVDYIEQGGRHLLSLINEVLDLSAIEAGKLVIDIDDVRLARLIDECLTLVFAPRCRPRHSDAARHTTYRRN